MPSFIRGRLLRVDDVLWKERKITKKYTNGKVTVVWQPHVCVHSSVCWKGLLNVFNPSVKPWINMDGASSERIVEQVQQCPSGALSYYMNHENHGDNVKPENAP